MQLRTDLAAEFRVKCCLVEVQQKVPREPSGLLRSKCGPSGPTFSCRRAFPCDLRHYFQTRHSPGPLAFAPKLRREGQGQGLDSLSRTTSPIISTTALRLRLLDFMCLQLLFLTYQSISSTIIMWGLWREAIPPLGMSGASWDSQPPVQWERHGHPLASGPVCLRLCLKSEAPLLRAAGLRKSLRFRNESPRGASHHRKELPC